MGHSTAYDRIREKIVRNEIAPGEKVNIDALVRELGVSQTPVREALQHLEGDGLVMRGRGRGYTTTPLLDGVQLRHMFEVRMLLEPWAVRVGAVDRLTNPGPELVELVDAFAREHSPLCSRTDLIAHDMEFHQAIHRATGNGFLRDAYDGMHAQLHLFRLFGDDVDSTDTLEEHREVARAIAACEPDAAERAMRTHLRCSMRRFLTESGAGEPHAVASGSDSAEPDLPGTGHVMD